MVSKINLSRKLFSKCYNKFIMFIRVIFFAKTGSDNKSILSTKLKIIPFFWDIEWLEKKFLNA